MGLTMYKQEHSRHRKTIYKKYEMGYGEMLYTEAIKPYLGHLLEVFNNFISKFIIALFVIGTGFLELGKELFNTPEIWVTGIAIMVVLDWASGTLRALVDDDIKFSFKRWTKTAFKIAAFSIAITSVVVGSNMFPFIFGWLQYVVYALLTANEIRSILTNLKMMALAEVIYDMMANKISDIAGISDLWREVDKRALETFQKKQGDNYTRYKVEEEVTHEQKITAEEESQ